MGASEFRTIPLPVRKLAAKFPVSAAVIISPLAAKLALLTISNINAYDSDHIGLDGRGHRAGRSSFRHEQVRPCESTFPAEGRAAENQTYPSVHARYAPRPE